MLAWLCRRVVVVAWLVLLTTLRPRSIVVDTMRHRTLRNGPFKSLGRKMLLERLETPKWCKQSRIADALGVRPQAVANWINRLTKPCERLRPLVFGVLGIPPEAWDTPVEDEEKVAA